MALAQMATSAHRPSSNEAQHPVPQVHQRSRRPTSSIGGFHKDAEITVERMDQSALVPHPETHKDDPQPHTITPHLCTPSLDKQVVVSETAEASVIQPLHPTSTSDIQKLTDERHGDTQVAHNHFLHQLIQRATRDLVQMGEQKPLEVYTKFWDGKKWANITRAAQFLADRDTLIGEPEALSKLKDLYNSKPSWWKAIVPVIRDAYPEVYNNPHFKSIFPRKVYTEKTKDTPTRAVFIETINREVSRLPRDERGSRLRLILILKLFTLARGCDLARCSP